MEPFSEVSTQPARDGFQPSSHGQTMGTPCHAWFSSPIESIPISSRSRCQTLHPPLPREEDTSRAFATRSLGRLSCDRTLRVRGSWLYYERSNRTQRASLRTERSDATRCLGGGLVGRGPRQGEVGCDWDVHGNRCTYQHKLCMQPEKEVNDPG